MKIERVLIVENNETEAKELAEQFKKRLGGGGADEVVVCTRDLRDAIRQVRSQSFSVIVLDMSFVREDEGVLFLRAVRTFALAQSPCPIVVLTARDKIEICVRAMQAGAADYILKGTAGSRSLNEDTADRTIHACEVAVARAWGEEEKKFAEWRHRHEKDLQDAFPGRSLAVFPPGRTIAQATTVGNRGILAFDDPAAVLIAFRENLDWLDHDVQFLAIPSTPGDGDAEF
jgi:CheY-like chemotaxis protein